MRDPKVETVSDTDPIMLALAKLLGGELGDAPEEGPAEVATPESNRTLCDDEPIFDPSNPEHRAEMDHLAELIPGLLSFVVMPASMREAIVMSSHAAFHNAPEGEEKEKYRRTALVYAVAHRAVAGMVFHAHKA